MTMGEGARTMGDSGFFDIIFFAVVAAVLVYRLRSVLGKRTGHEPPPRQHEPFPPPPSDAARDNVVTLPERQRAGERADDRGEARDDIVDAPALGGKSDLHGGIARIKAADPNFDPDGFLEGAGAAFESVVAAYAQGDSKTLRALLNKEMFESFMAAIEERRERGETHETTIVAVRGADIVDASLQGRTAYVTVKFVTEQINVTRDKVGTVIDGDASKAIEITDIWTFARTVRSSDPNWLLVKTDSAD